MQTGAELRAARRRHEGLKRDLEAFQASLAEEQLRSAALARQEEADKRVLLERHDHEIKALLNSSSWRMSAPWRAFRRQLSRLRRLLRGKKANPLFDRRWYMQQYSDVKESEIEPYIHYLKHGALEGRDPNPYFDTDWYLEHNADVSGSGLNPLVHFYLHGAAEGRDPHPTFSNKWFIGQSLPHRGIAARNYKHRPNPSTT
jgi:hypothetical protein